jgi:hypothetical protein
MPGESIRRAAGRQGEAPRRGGRVAALADLLRQGADTLFRRGQERVEEGALADPRLPDEDTVPSRQGLAQRRRHGVAGRAAQYRVTEGPVGSEKRIQGVGIRRVEEVALVEEDQGLGAEDFRGHEVAVDQVRVRFRQRGDDDHHEVDIGGDGAQGAKLVRALQRRMAWLQGHHDAVLTGVAVSGAEDHPVAGNRRLEVGAQEAAPRLPVRVEQVHLLAVLRDHRACLLVATRRVVPGVHGAAAAAVGDAPALPVVESAFAHAGIIGWGPDAVERVLDSR